MRARTVLLLLVAISAATLAAMFARGWMHSQQAAMAKKPAPLPVAATEVLVAGHPIPAGTFIKADDLRWQPWPEGTLAKDYVVKGKGGSVDPFVNAVVKIGFNAGEPVTVGRIAKPGDRGFLAAVLSPGTRAVTVSVNPTTGVSGFVLPGDRVDVLVTHSVASQGVVKRSMTVTETALEDLRVIAVDQTTDDQSNKAVLAKTITLEATPKQAEELNLAAQLGHISLALRSLPAPKKPEPRRRRFTVDGEVSPLLAGLGRKEPTVQVVRGEKKVEFVGGSASAKNADSNGDHAAPSDPAMETSAAEAAVLAGAP
jgi:pilus assembly protein CpaB